MQQGEITKEQRALLNECIESEITLEQLIFLNYLKDVDVKFMQTRINDFILALVESDDHDMVTQEDWYWYLKLQQFFKSLY